MPRLRPPNPPATRRFKQAAAGACLALALWTAVPPLRAAQAPAPAPAPRPAPAAVAPAPVEAGEGNIFGDAIEYAQKRCVKIYGAGIGREHGYATGMIVSPHGDVLTAQGIYTNDPSRLRVVLPDGRTIQAVTVENGNEVVNIRIERQSEGMQLVLLKLIGVETPDFFEITDKPVVRKGDWVAAVGNAYNVAHGPEKLSANLGVVSMRSAMDVKKRATDVHLDCEILLIDAITSNPGAPGGVLMTPDGRVAGMIGKLIESKSTNTRLNYAIPNDQVRMFLDGKEFLPDAVIKAGGGAYLGIRLFKDAGKRTPAYVDQVVTGSPAAAAGLMADDMVMSLGGEIVRTVQDYEEAVRTLRPGKAVNLLIKRKSEILSLTLTPTAVADQVSATQPAEKTDVQPLTP